MPITELFYLALNEPADTRSYSGRVLSMHQAEARKSAPFGGRS